MSSLAQSFHEVLSRVRRISSITGSYHCRALQTGVERASSTPRISSNRTLQQTLDPPLLRLPVELIQHITSFLSRESAASFCLSNRYICYAIGIDQLYAYLREAKTNYERRTNITVLERAFPGHWFCAWCDAFHKQETKGGPRSFGKESKRNCASFNSYLTDGRYYFLAYHHVRLAMNRHLWGPDYGIGLEDFTYEHQEYKQFFKRLFKTELTVSARIVAHQFLLHARFSTTVPSEVARKRGFTEKLYRILPHIVAGHRSDVCGHTCLRKDIRDSIHMRRSSRVTHCTTCATDFVIHIRDPRLEYSQNYGFNGSPRELQITIEVWRDLGDGSTPFATQWRAHGENVSSRRAPRRSSKALRLACEKEGIGRGEIRDAFRGELPSTDCGRYSGLGLQGCARSTATLSGRHS